MKYIGEAEWLLSVSRDKSFHWHCAKTGRKLGSFNANAWCLAVEYPPMCFFELVPNTCAHVHCVSDVDQMPWELKG